MPVPLKVTASDWLAPSGVNSMLAWPLPDAGTSARAASVCTSGASTVSVPDSGPAAVLSMAPVMRLSPTERFTSGKA